MKFSVLDYSLLSENLSKLVDATIVNCGFSDHQAVKLHFRGREKEKKSVQIIKCRGKILSELAFQKDMELCVREASQRMENININEQALTLTKIFHNVLNVHAPLKEVKVRTGCFANISKETKQEMKCRNKYKNKLFNEKHTPIERLKARKLYKTHRNKVTVMLRKDKQRFVANGGCHCSVPRYTQCRS